MKKIIALLVLLAVVLSLASCDVLYQLIPPNTPGVLMNRINYKMGFVDSYRVNITGELNIVVDDVLSETDISGVQVVTGRNSTDDKYYYESQKYETVLTDPDTEEFFSRQTIETLIAYNDGKAYMENKTSEGEKKFYANTAYDEFLYLISDISDDFTDYAAEKAEFSRNEDKSWTYVQSCHSIEDIDDLAESIGVLENFSGVDITDMIITINATEEFVATSLSVEFVFADSEGKSERRQPKFVLTMRYDEIDSAEKVVIDESEYTEIDSVVALFAIEDKISDSCLDKDGSVRISAVVRDSNNPNGKETITILSYGEREDGYYYDLIQGNVTIKYSNEKAEITQNGRSQTITQSELEARVFVNSLLNPYAYQPVSVTDVVALDDGKYNIVLQLDRSDYSTIFPDYSIKTVEHTITVDILDGEIEIVEANITATTRKDAVSYTVKVTYDWGESNGVNQA